MGTRLQGRVALITGASRGIGAAVAKAYASEGAHVILVARTVGGLEEVDDEIRALGGTATLVPLDLTEGLAIDGLAAPILERWKKLDILVGNAAILGRLGPMGHFPPDMWEQVMAINVNANWRLIRALDPLLRASAAGRVIFVTSRVARTVTAYWGAYAASKAALENLAMTYAAEVTKTPVRVNLVCPGPTRTNMREAAFPGENPAQVPAPDHVAETFIALAEPSYEANGQWVAVDTAEPADQDPSST